MEYTTEQVLQELKAFTGRIWTEEPADIQRLRQVSRPPMGILPCIFYANFNLFWAGENLQVFHQCIKDDILELSSICIMISKLLERQILRLQKWDMQDTVAIEQMLIAYFRSSGPATREEFLTVLETALLALDRMQSWIDRILPWEKLDTQLTLHTTIQDS